MHEILWCYHSNETASIVLSRGESVDEILRCYHQMKPLWQYFHAVVFAFQYFSK